MVFSSTSILASCVPNESNLAWREASDSSMAMLLAGGVVGDASGEAAVLLVLLFGIDETERCKHWTADGVEQLSRVASCRGSRQFFLDDTTGCTYNILPKTMTIRKL